MQRPRCVTSGRWRTGCVIGFVALTGLLRVQETSAQGSVQARLSAEWAGLRSATGAYPTFGIEALGSFDVVALRVEFQPDTTRYSTGDGTFEGLLYSDGLMAAIDPLPHDAAYFEAHLDFLEHYVATVSHGRAAVRTHLLPGVVRVSRQMGSYSPTGRGADSDEELSKMATFIREAWSGAPEAIGLPALDPERTAFVIFHAGVGRDIELVGTTLDKTPEDLPSLFFDADALDRLAPGDVPVVGGIDVDNTLLIPRTETRQGFDFIADESFLAEFSINGMLAASFLNFLGVPDLFDTRTGESAIGPFGLMDGQGIFAMSGLFPPRPSAWTRMVLGWADAQIVEANTPVRFELSVSDPDIALVPVSDGEFFLAEVRHRDPDGSGVRMTVWRDGTTSDIVFENGDDGFNPQSQDGFAGGVVTAVEPYDFALPGGMDDDGNPLVGGVLLWHVDERALVDGLPTNRVNADPERRAVDLEEADGAQDIGHPTGGFFGPAFHLGSPFDFWYEGNPVAVISSTGAEITLYENRFGPDTVPPSESNAGGPTFVQIGGFSAPRPTMTFTIERVSTAGLTPVPGLSGMLDIEATDAASIIKPLPDGAVVFGVASDGTGALAIVSESGVVYAGQELLASEPATDDESVYALSVDGFVRIRADGGVESIGSVPGGPLTGATTAVLLAPDGTVRAGVETAAGPRFIECAAGTCTIDEEHAVSIALTDQGELIRVSPTEVRFGTGDMFWTYPEVSGTIRPAFGRDRNGVLGAVPDPGSGRLHILRPDRSVLTIDVGPDVAPAPLVMDTNGDGLLEIVVPAGDHLLGYERTGAVSAGFPLALGAAGRSVVATRRGDAEPWLFLVTTQDGHLEAVDQGRGRRPITGFPLTVGAAGRAAPLVASNRIWVLSPAGRLQVWELEDELRDAEAFADHGNSSFTVPESSDPPTETPDALLLARETYNWPNPVQGGATRIRFQLTEPARVSIRILDLSGRLVDTLELQSPDSGVPVEVPWAADVPSGVYFARVSASTASGRTESRLVRMAVIR